MTMSSMMLREPIALPASQIANDLNGQDLTLRFGTPAINISLIDERVLLGEVLLAGLRNTDPSCEYTFYTSVEGWMSSEEQSRTEVILFSLDKRASANSSDAAAALKLLNERRPEIPIILISSEEDPEAIIKALEYGAEGYIGTSMQLRAAVQVIHLVHAGGTFIPATSLQALAKRSTKVVEEVAPQESVFSPREMLVAKALRKGTPNKIIAYELNMCESTVKVHVRHIMKKLKAKNRTQVAFLTNSMFCEDGPA